MNNWEIATAVAAVTAVILAAFALWYAIRNLKKLREQTEYLRRQIFGELYDNAQVENLRFFLPEKRKHRVKGFKQIEDKEIDLGQTVTIPLGLERELHIHWQMAEAQTLRGYNLGFKGDYGSKPIILGIRRAFIKTLFQEFVREEYVDWHGDFHCEYAHHRRLLKDENFVAAIRVIGVLEGDYQLRVSVAVDEAPKRFEGYLTVRCAKKK